MSSRKRRSSSGSRASKRGRKSTDSEGSDAGEAPKVMMTSVDELRVFKQTLHRICRSRIRAFEGSREDRQVLTMVLAQLADNVSASLDAHVSFVGSAKTTVLTEPLDRALVERVKELDERLVKVSKEVAELRETVPTAVVRSVGDQISAARESLRIDDDVEEPTEDDADAGGIPRERFDELQAAYEQLAGSITSQAASLESQLRESQQLLKVMKGRAGKGTSSVEAVLAGQKSGAGAGAGSGASTDASARGMRSRLAGRLGRRK